MKLITERIENVQYITEAAENGKKSLFITGPFLVAEQGNKNKRIYKLDTLKREVDRYNEEYVKTNRALGELGHPDTPSINLERVSHIITELNQDGNVFVGKAKILDTPYGNIVKNFIDSGVSLGVSSRGLGTTVPSDDGYSIVQDDFRLSTAADIVADPSAPGAFVNGIMENKEFWYDQAKNTWIEVPVERLLEKVNKFSKSQIENKALQLFEWYMDGISRKR